jgi:PPOX class probable F420-dependent enzyme
VQFSVLTLLDANRPLNHYPGQSQRLQGVAAKNAKDSYNLFGSLISLRPHGGLKMAAAIAEKSGGIPEKYRDLFNKRAFASLSTLMPDGRPQVTPVWCDLEGNLVIFNSAKGRQKDKNVRRDPRVALAIVDPDNPYRYLEIRGKVVEITERGADEHIDKMAKKYLDVDKYPYRQASEVRVIYKIQPEHTTTMG